MNLFENYEDFINENLRKELRTFAGAEVGEPIKGSLKTSHNISVSMDLVRKGYLQIVEPHKEHKNEKDRIWFALTQKGYDKVETYISSYERY